MNSRNILNMKLYRKSQGAEKRSKPQGMRENVPGPQEQATSFLRETHTWPAKYRKMQKAQLRKTPGGSAWREAPWCFRLVPLS